MIKPTHYDDEGYPIQWVRSNIPANSLASVYGLASDSAKRNILGENVSIKLHVIDETNEYVNFKKLIKMIEEDGGHALVGFIGIQSNQFPRAVDLAKRFLSHNIQVAIGGFHVSGTLSMLHKLTPELIDAQELGISFFAGEAENKRLDEVLIDAYNKKLKPMYDHLDDMPSLENEPTPILPAEAVRKTLGVYSSFDLGRGCPFDCSFCTIINVQGKKSRFRTADDLEKILRDNAAINISKFFLTDDNFARNKNWELILDRMILLKEEGLKITLSIQVDTLCHKIPNFMNKCFMAGVDQVFMGLENINKENLLSINKPQNKINDYKNMVLAWKRYPVILIAGYIIGLPNDSHRSIVSDIETIKNELAIDILYFTMITPLPGSEDHQKMYAQGIWMDPDLNKYDLNHRVTHHTTMSNEEWDLAYADAWNTFYTFDHMKTILKRRVALKNGRKLTTVNRLILYKEYKRLYQVHSLEGGIIRIKRRTERRPTLPLESIWIFYPKYWFETVSITCQMITSYIKLYFTMKKIWKDPLGHKYIDDSMRIEKDTLNFTTKRSSS